MKIREIYYITVVHFIIVFQSYIYSKITFSLYGLSSKQQFNYFLVCSSVLSIILFWATSCANFNPNRKKNKYKHIYVSLIIFMYLSSSLTDMLVKTNYESVVSAKFRIYILNKQLFIQKEDIPTINALIVGLLGLEILSITLTQKNNKNVFKGKNFYWFRFSKIVLKKGLNLINSFRDFRAHILFWIYLIVIINSYKNELDIVGQLITFYFSIALFYLSLFIQLKREYIIQHRFFEKDANIKLYGILFIISIFHLALEAALLEYVSKAFLVDQLVVFNTILVIAGLWGATAERSNKLNEEKLLEISKKEKITEKLHESLLENSNLLNTQIGSHFFFNSLNFLRHKSSSASPELSNSIILLSDIIRYSLESTKPNQNQIRSKRVALIDEITHLKNFIDYCQLTTDESLYINFDTCGQTAYSSITPLLLIPFVENAFKYGDLSDSSSPLTIKLNIERGVLTFTVQNKKKSQLNAFNTSTKIGLKNVKNRLKSEYPQYHTLTIIDELDSFLITLKITL